MKDAKAAQIRNLALFQGCSAAEIRRLCAWADVVDVPAGRVLAAGGSTAREFAVVMSGAAVAGDDVVLGPGSFFGHSALIAGGAHPSAVVALAPTRVLVFGARTFRAAMDRTPSLARAILRDLAARRDDYQDVRRLRAVS